MRGDHQCRGTVAAAGKREDVEAALPFCCRLAWVSKERPENRHWLPTRPEHAGSHGRKYRPLRGWLWRSLASVRGPGICARAGA